MKNNLLVSSKIISNTVSGIGNKALTVSEIRYLYDKDATVFGIFLLPTDSLCLDIDLFERFKVADMKLYMSTANRNSGLSKINFQYKNIELESYTTCGKDYNEEYFYATGFPTIYAPRYVRITISGIDATLYECEITNDDSLIGFGELGEDTVKYIDHDLDSYDILPIFNNSPLGTKPVTAYIAIDRKFDETDKYIKIANNKDGPYKGVNDDSQLSNEPYSVLSSHYKAQCNWDKGVFDDTTVTGEKVIIDPISLAGVGYYTTPVLDAVDKLNRPYFSASYTTYSGLSVSWNPGAGNIVKIRSSDIEPLSFTKFFFIYKQNMTAAVYAYIGDLTTGIKTTEYLSTTPELPYNIIFDRNNMKYVVLQNSGRVCKYPYIYDPEIVTNRLEYDSGPSSNYNINDNWELDVEGNVWGFGTYGAYSLYVFSSITNTVKTLINNGSNPLLRYLSVSLIDNSCWYTDIGSNSLKHINFSGALMQSISLNKPTFVAALPDGGCLVYDEPTSIIHWYSYTGDLVKEINYTYNKKIVSMRYGLYRKEELTTHPFIWILTESNYVLRYSFDGVVLMEQGMVSATSIHPFFGGCLVHSNDSKKTYQLNNNGETVYVWDYGGLDGTIGIRPCPVVITYPQFKESLANQSTFNLSTGNQPILPLNDDPIWGSGHDNGWTEIDSAWTRLPVGKYYQFKFRLNSTALEVPIVNPSFEQISPWGWSGYDSTFRSSTAYSGSYSSCSNGSGALYGHQDIQLSTIANINFAVLDSIQLGYIFSSRCWVRANQERTEFYLTLWQYNSANTLLSTSCSAKVTALNYWRPLYLNTKIVPTTRKITFRFDMVSSNYAYVDNISAKLIHSPSIDAVIFSNPTQIPDIQPQSYGNLYIKKEIPIDAQYKEYETKLKCWWGN